MPLFVFVNINDHLYPLGFFFLAILQNVLRNEQVVEVSVQLFGAKLVAFLSKHKWMGDLSSFRLNISSVPLLPFRNVESSITGVHNVSIVIL